jgi:hypothetical protein
MSRPREFHLYSRLSAPVTEKAERPSQRLLKDGGNSGINEAILYARNN